jgi:hypothetical protein
VEGFLQDIAAQPEVYRATIPDAAPQDQPLLHRMLSLIVETVEAYNMDDNQRIDELTDEYYKVAHGFENRMQKVWTDLYFVGDIWKEADLCLSITDGQLNFTNGEILS